MTAEYNKKSFIFGIPGIVLQTAGCFIRTPEGMSTPLGVIFVLVGTVLLLIGLTFYAKAKGRHPAWCLFGLLSIIGLIILVCLKDKSVQKASETTTDNMQKQ